MDRDKVKLIIAIGCIIAAIVIAFIFLNPTGGEDPNEPPPRLQVVPIE